MFVDSQKVPLAEFEAFIQHPENVNRDWELIDGRIIQVVSNRRSSRIGLYIGGKLSNFNESKGNIGWVTGADGGYVIGDERYIPDVAYISKVRQPERFDDEAYNPNPPDLAIEVLSPTNSADDMRIKIVNYLRAGTTVWLFNPDTEKVQVLSPVHPPRTLGINETLDGGDILPGFNVSVKDIFAS